MKDYLRPIDLERIQVPMQFKTREDLLDNWEHLEELRVSKPKCKQGRSKEKYYQQQLSQWNIG